MCLSLCITTHALYMHYGNWRRRQWTEIERESEREKRTLHLYGFRTGFCAYKRWKHVWDLPTNHRNLVLFLSSLFSLSLCCTIVDWIHFRSQVGYWRAFTLTFLLIFLILLVMSLLWFWFVVTSLRLHRDSSFSFKVLRAALIKRLNALEISLLVST